MPIKKGLGHIRENMQELMKPPQSASRRKAINTIAKQRNIPKQQAQWIQSKAISIAQGRKK